MIIRLTLHSLVLMVCVVILTSCAKPPYQELDAAEYMIARARSLRAPEYAPTEYHAATSALNEARGSMQIADYGDAQKSLEFALQHARRAIARAEERQARLAEDAARRALEEQRAEQARLAAEEQSRAAAEADRLARQQQEVKIKPPEPQPKIEPVNEYAVGEGETLWTISAQPEVYGEGLLWPLLYQANRDQIKDPRQIFPGQTLSIHRDMGAEEVEEARQKARESDIFPIPQEPRNPQ